MPLGALHPSAAQTLLPSLDLERIANTREIRFIQSLSMMISMIPGILQVVTARGTTALPAGLDLRNSGVVGRAGCLALMLNTYLC